MSKLLSVFGRAGSGKSTFAVNLACALAAKENVVILISANLSHGNLQVFFGEVVPEDQGIFEALNDTAERPQDKLTPCKLSKNIFLLDIPNNRAEIFAENMEQKKVEDLFRRLGICTDYLIVDCTGDLYNPITLMALHLADKIYCTYLSSIASCLWCRTITNFFNLFGTSVEPVIAEYNIGCSIQEFLKKTGLKCEIILPEIEHAPVLQNSGKPIYYEKSKECREYNMAIDSIAADLQGEE